MSLRRAQGACYAYGLRSISSRIIGIFKRLKISSTRPRWGPCTCRGRGVSLTWSNTWAMQPGLFEIGGMRVLILFIS